MKKLFFMLFACTLVLGLAACDNGEKEDDKAVLNWNIGADPLTLDPGLNGASDGGNVINNTFEGLVREKNGEVLPGMAEDWEVSEDGKTVTFIIRDDAKWSDGTPITADDFVRSWKRGMDPRNISEYAWIWHYTNVVGANDFVDSDSEDDAVLDALADDVGIKSLENGKKLEVKLSYPTNWFVSLMAFYHFMPVPESATTDENGSWAKDPEKAISNGPYKLVEYNKGSDLKLVKNDEYWNADEVGIDEINGYFIDSETTAFAKYNAGELDFLLNVPTAEIPSLIAESDEFHVYPLLGTYYINFNLSGCDNVGGTRDVGGRDNTIFCNAKLRNALSYSIDREAITEALAAGQVPAAGFIPPGMLDDEGNDFFETSKSQSDIVADDGSYAIAQQLFAEAATELGMTEEELRTELETKSYRYNTSESHQKVGELMQESWRTNLGFEIQLANEEWALFQETRKNGDFDLARGGWLTDFMDPSGMIGIFVTDNAYNTPDYSNPTYEAKLEEAKTAPNAEAHFDRLYEAHQIFISDMPVIPVYHYVDMIYANDKVEGWDRSVLGSVDFSTAKINEE
ncbi:peptide ABC transporter substrate-binding protein [Haloplasma contractile]|uniref:Oligopeptide-binding protein OppA n=1 Tax=Haloplasma contractile SSD-17B TaxID=1033810 RepID=U2E9X5_9MOLU|nr:peptide ABC transporter substrate-binding protein [Haloplasma contractile]ERJ11646.1 Oligopeptide-binding protein OppA [Haloplasma contractile SSD-17B]